MCSFTWQYLESLCVQCSPCVWQNAECNVFVKQVTGLHGVFNFCANHMPAVINAFLYKIRTVVASEKKKHLRLYNILFEMSIHPIICTHQWINLSLAWQIILSSKIVSTNLTVFKQLKTVRSNMSPLLRLQSLMDSTNTTKVPGMLPN